MAEDIVSQANSTLKSNGKWAGKEAKKAISDVQDEAESTISTAKRTFDNAVDSVTDRASDLAGKIDFSQATGLIEKYPIQVAFGALAVGFMLGAALTRKTT